MDTISTTTGHRAPSRVRRLAVLAVPALAAAALTAVPGALPATAAEDRASSQQRQRDLATARQASARFHDVEDAIAAGFHADPHCEESPLGGMGHHYVNFANFGSTDPAKPAVLLYAPSPNGGLRLAGVEWVVPDGDQDLATDRDRPSMFDGTAFQGPMKGHVPGMPVHYDLHVWLWQANPAGLFEPWNTSIDC